MSGFIVRQFYMSSPLFCSTIHSLHFYGQAFMVVKYFNFIIIDSQVHNPV